MDTKPESWAVVELLGHLTMAGRLTEEERFGSKLGRLDIPDDQGGFTTVFFGGSSVYRITAVSEPVARIKARDNQPQPVYAWELREPKAEPSKLSFEPSEPCSDDDDDMGDRDDDIRF